MLYEPVVLSVVSWVSSTIFVTIVILLVAASQIASETSWHSKRAQAATADKAFDRTLH